MADLPVPIAVDQATFDGLDPNLHELHQLAIVTSTDGVRLPWIAVGADGARTWEPFAPHQLGDLPDVTSPAGATAGWVLTTDGTAADWTEPPSDDRTYETVDTDAGGLFAVILGTAWRIDPSTGQVTWRPEASVVDGPAQFGLDDDGRPYVEPVTI